MKTKINIVEIDKSIILFIAIDKLSNEVYLSYKIMILILFIFSYIQFSLLGPLWILQKSNLQ